MKMIRNGLKIDFKKTQNLAKNRQKAWAIAHENDQKLPKNRFQKNSKSSQKSSKSMDYSP